MVLAFEYIYANQFQFTEVPELRPVALRSVNIILPEMNENMLCCNVALFSKSTNRTDPLVQLNKYLSIFAHCLAL